MATLTGGQIVWILDADTGQFERALLQAEEQAQQTGQEIDRSLSDSTQSATGALREFGRSLADVGFNLFTTGAGIAAGALASMATKGIQAADFMETTTIAMSGLTGSVEEGNKAISIAANFWENNPFNRLDVVPATKSLIQFGRSTEQVASDLELLGDISLSTGTPIQDLALYFSRTAGAGRAMTEDLEMMAFRGVPIYQKLVDILKDSDSAAASAARSTAGLTKQSEINAGTVREMASDSQISFEIFEEAMKAAVNPEAMEAFEQTFSRQVDRFKGSLSILRGEIGGYRIENGKLTVEQDGLTKSFTRLAEAFATGLRTEEMRESMARLGKALVPLIDRMAEAAPKILDAFGKAVEFVSKNTEILLPVLGGAAILFGQIGAQLPVIGPLIGGIGGSVGKLAKKFKGLFLVNPLLGAFIALLVYGFQDAFRNNEDFRESMFELFDAVQNVIQALLPSIKTLFDAFAQIAGSDAFVKVLQLAVESLTLILNLIARIPPDVFTALLTGFLGFKALKPILGIVGTASNAIGGLTGKLGGLAVKGAGALKGKGKGGLGKLIASIFKPLGSSEVIKGAVAAALIGGAIFAIALGLGKASSTDIDFLKVAAISGAVVVLAGIFALLGKIAPKVAVGSLAIGVMALALYGVAIAIQKVDNAVPNDIGDFAKKMANIGIAIASIGLLAVISSALIAQILVGLAGVLAISGSLVLVARAIKYVSDTVPSNVGDFSKKIANIGIAIGAMGLLAGIIGGIALTGIGAAAIGAGLAIILAIAGSLVAISKSIRIMYDAIPSDIDKVEGKITLVGTVITKLADAVGANIFSTGLKVINIKLIQRIINDYIEIAASLRHLEGINLNESAIEEKIDIVSSAIALVTDTSDESVGGLISGAARNFIETVDVSLAEDIVQTYKDIADKLKELQDIQLDKDAVVKAVNIVFDTIKKVSSPEDTGFGDQLTSLLNNFLNRKEVSLVKDVVDVYYDIAQKLNEIKGIELDADLISDKIDLLGDVIEKVSYSGDGSIWGNLGNAINQFIDTASVQNAGRVVNVYADIIDALNKISGFDLDVPGIKEKINDLSDVVKVVIDTEGGGGIFGAIGDFFGGGSISEQQVSQVQSIINKFSEIGQTVMNMGGVIKSVAMQKVETIRDIIYEIGQINEVQGLGDKERIVSQTQSILNKMSGMAHTLSRMTGVIPSVINQKITALRDAIYQIGQINEVPGMANKETIVGLAQSILNKMIGMAQTLMSIPKVEDEQVDNMRTMRNIIYELGQINQVPDMANKEFIVGVSQSILNKMTEVARTLNTMPELGEGRIALMRKLRNAVYEVTQINQDVGDLNYKADIVKRANKILGNIIDFAQTLAEMPKVGDGIVGSIKKAIDAVNEIGNNTLANLKEKAGQFKNVGAQYGKNLADGIRGAITLVASAGADTQSAFHKALESKMRDHYYQGAEFVNRLIKGINSRRNGMADAGSQLQGRFWRAIENKLQDHYHQGRELARRLVAGIKDGTRGMYTAGANAVQGFINGVRSRSTYNVGWSAANSFLQGVKDRGRQGSPWKTTKEIGGYAMEGFEAGIHDSESSLMRTVNSIVDSVVMAFTNGNAIMSPQLQAPRISDIDNSFGELESVSRSIGTDSSDGSQIENNIGEIHIGNEVDAEDWLRKLTRQDEVIRGGLTPYAQ